MAAAAAHTAAAPVDDDDAPPTLAEWQAALAVDPPAAGLLACMRERYADASLVDERLSCYRALVSSLPAHSFSPAAPLAIVASPGRDRLFMGHTDLAGLGGFTLDCATREELLCAAQRTDDGCVWLFNSDPEQFPATSFLLADLLPNADDEANFGQRLYQANSQGYVQAALTYMMCKRFSQWEATRAALLPSSSAPSSGSSASASSGVSPGVRFYITSPGSLRLSHAGGISSSAALTGAISMLLCQLFPPMRHFGLSTLAEVDYGEYYLAKMAGAADKMAQMYAIRDSVTVISSLPESLRRIVHFPTQECALLICTSPIPRLTMHALSLPFLQSRGYTPEHCRLVQEYAEEIMGRFGSVAYVVAVELLLEALKDRPRYERVGLSTEQANLLHTALLTHPPLAFTPDPEPGATSGTTSSSSGSSRSGLIPSSAAPPPTPCDYKGGLLRELCDGGSLESLGGHQLAGWPNRHRRYELIFRALKLLPERYLHPVPTQKKYLLLDLRKAALYGLAELERGAEYLRCLDDIRTGKQSAGDTPARIDPQLNRILELTALCHDGDRAVVDYRHLLLPSEVPTVDAFLAGCQRHPSAPDGFSMPVCSARFFARTPWSSDPRNDVSDRAIDGWVSSGRQELADLPGGFERGLIDMDEMADLVHERYAGRACSSAPPSRLSASIRISAAGLSGRVCVHARPEITADLEQFLQSQGWEVRRPTPAAPTQVMRCSQTK